MESLPSNHLQHSFVKVLNNAEPVSINLRNSMCKSFATHSDYRSRIIFKSKSDTRNLEFPIRIISYRIQPDLCHPDVTQRLDSKGLKMHWKEKARALSLGQGWLWPCWWLFHFDTPAGSSNRGQPVADEWEPTQRPKDSVHPDSALATALSETWAIRGTIGRPRFAEPHYTSKVKMGHVLVKHASSPSACIQHLFSFASVGTDLGGIVWISRLTAS